MPIDNTMIAKMYIDAIKNCRLESVVLLKLPELVTCNDWNQVEIAGAVDYISERSKAVYKGLLVKYKGGLYFMRQKLVDALGAIDRRFKVVKTVIRID